MSKDPASPPIINAPPGVTALAVALIVLHGARWLAPEGIDYFIQANFALLPDRFWPTFGVGGPGAAGYAYASPLFALFTLLSTAFVHGDFIHVILNSAMLVGIGKPVYEDLAYRRPGERARATELFIYVFLLSVIGGSIAHLAANFPSGAGAVGASGGVCGLLAALLLLQMGPRARILSRQFLTVGAGFIVVNIVLALIGPALLGSGIAWQAHVGGYVAGAAIYRVILWRRAAMAR